MGSLLDQSEVQNSLSYQATSSVPAAMFFSRCNFLDDDLSDVLGQVRASSENVPIVRRHPGAQAVGTLEILQRLGIFWILNLI